MHRAWKEKLEAEAIEGESWPRVAMTRLSSAECRRLVWCRCPVAGGL